MAEIARATGLGTGTIYNYFPTKADLLLSVIAARSPDFIARFPQARATVVLSRRLDALIALYLESFSAIARPIWRELLATGLTNRPDLFGHVATIDAPFITELVACLAQLGATDSTSRAQALYQTLIGTILLWLAVDDHSPTASLASLNQRISQAFQILGTPSRL